MGARGWPNANPSGESGLKAVSHDLPWVAGVLATKRLAEETFVGLLVALGAEPEVDGLPGAVDGAVEVAPLPVHSHVDAVCVVKPVWPRQHDSRPHPSARRSRGAPACASLRSGPPSC